MSFYTSLLLTRATEVGATDHVGLCLQELWAGLLGQGGIRTTLFSHSHWKYSHSSCQGSCVAPAIRSGSHVVYGAVLWGCLPTGGSFTWDPWTTKGLPCPRTVLKGACWKTLSFRPQLHSTAPLFKVSWPIYASKCWQDSWNVEQNHDKILVFNKMMRSLTYLIICQLQEDVS